MKYILGSKPQGCILCQMIQETEDRRNLIVYRGERGFIGLNLYPYSNGHLMISPYQHVSSLELLDEASQAELMRLVSLGIRLLRETMRPGGFNVGVNIGKAAGAGIDEHVHVHVVPRWEGDTNFMGTIGETRVLPEVLETTLDQLVAALKVVQGGPKI